MGKQRNITVTAPNGQRVTYTSHDIDVAGATILSLCARQDESPEEYIKTYPTELANAIRKSIRNGGK
jgi:hypothetical protein